MRHLAPVLFLIPLAALGCHRAEATFSVTPSVGVPNLPAKASDAYPSRDEVLDYLDGKTISLSSPPANGEPQFVVKRDQIEALEIEQSGTSVDNGPWVTAMTFIAKTNEGRYAVKMTVRHRQVEGKRAFFGFRVTEMSKQ